MATKPLVSKVHDQLDKLEMDTRKAIKEKPENGKFLVDEFTKRTNDIGIDGLTDDQKKEFKQAVAKKVKDLRALAKSLTEKKNMGKKNLKESKDKYKFTCVDNLEDYVDSLLFDEYDRVATLESDEGDILYIDVFGEKTIEFDGETYYDTSDYPDELVKMIKDGSVYDSDRVNIINNNWFDIVYETTEDGFVNDDVYEEDLSRFTKDELKQDMIDTLEYWKDEFYGDKNESLNNKRLKENRGNKMGRKKTVMEAVDEVGKDKNITGQDVPMGTGKAGDMRDCVHAEVDVTFADAVNQDKENRKKMGRMWKDMEKDAKDVTPKDPDAPIKEKNMFTEKLTLDESLFEAVEETPNKSFAKNIRTKLGESKKSKLTEARLPRKVVVNVDDLNLDDEDFDDEEYVIDVVGDELSDRYGFCHYGFNYDIERDKDGKPIKVICKDIDWDTSESLKEDKTSLRDRVDAKRDNRVERAKARFNKVRDDTDAQRDDRLKKRGLKESKVLMEGPGAGYKVSGTIDDIKINKVNGVEIKDIKENGYSYKKALVSVDGTASISDIRVESYYYGNTVAEGGSVPVKIVAIGVGVDEYSDEPDANDLNGWRGYINDLAESIDFTSSIGGGWVHSKFTGAMTIESGTSDINDLEVVIENQNVIKAIDDAATGDDWLTEYRVRDENGDEIEYFEDEDEAIEFAKKNRGVEVVKSDYQVALMNDLESEDVVEWGEFETVWERPYNKNYHFDESMKRRPSKRGLKEKNEYPGWRHMSGSERHNARMNRIFDRFEQRIDDQVKFLIAHGVSEEEARKLKANTGLGKNAVSDKLVELGLEDEYWKTVTESLKKEIDEAVTGCKGKDCKTAKRVPSKKLKEGWYELEMTVEDVCDELEAEVKKQFPDFDGHVYFDDSRAWSLYIDGAKIGLPVRKFGAYRDYLGGGVRGNIEHNGRTQDGTVELGKKFADGLRRIEDSYNSGFDGPEWYAPTGVLMDESKKNSTQGVQNK